VLYRAADLIEERGWAHGTYNHVAAAVCLESAISLAHNGVTGLEAWNVANTCPAGTAMREHLGLGRWNQTSNSLWNWNDMQSARKVVEALRAAAVIEAAKENTDARAAVSA
jgi:hypothetical protein